MTIFPAAATGLALADAAIAREPAAGDGAPLGTAVEVGAGLGVTAASVAIAAATPLTELAEADGPGEAAVAGAGVPSAMLIEKPSSVGNGISFRSGESVTSPSRTC